ncbi:MAG: hypothetical protein ABIS59_01240 [Candidatus Saccharibacteria bacterium]
MARSDIYRRERSSDAVRDNAVRENEVVENEVVENDTFYETMPMTATPMMREHTTVIRESNHDEAYEGNGVLLAERIVSFIVGAVESLLGLRLLLAVFNYLGVITTANEFARIIYQITNPLVAPFSSLFNSTYSDPGVWTIAFAMIVYAIIGYGIKSLIRIGRPREY